MRSHAPCSFKPDEFASKRSDLVRKCKAICAGCPIREACLEDILEMEEQLGHAIHGTVGGTTEAERVQLHVKRSA